MLHSLLFVMSLSGSSIVLLYLIIYPAFGYRLPLTYRYFLLKAAIFFYLVPIEKLKFYILGILCKVSPVVNKHFTKSMSITNMKNIIILENGIKRYAFQVKCIYGLTFAMVMASLIIVARQSANYYWAKRHCLNNSCELTNPEYQQAFLSIKQKLNIRKNIRLMSSVFCRSPIVIGIRAPTIILPDNTELSGSQKYIISHELIHIIHKDLLIKILAFITIAIHWYNPFVYLLYHEIEIISELVCDERVIRILPDAERQIYSNLILDMAANAETNNYSIGFVSNYAIMKRRILEMKKKQPRKTLLSALIIVSICFTGVITAFAYAPASILEDGTCNFSDDYIFFNELPQIESIPYDYFFTSADGTISKVNKQQKESCTHDFQAGSTTRHTKHNDGSCTVTKREAQKCRLCGYTKTGNIISTTNYPKCPH